MIKSEVLNENGAEKLRLEVNGTPIDLSIELIRIIREVYRKFNSANGIVGRVFKDSLVEALPVAFTDNDDDERKMIKNIIHNLSKDEDECEFRIKKLMDQFVELPLDEKGQFMQMVINHMENNGI